MHWIRRITSLLLNQKSELCLHYHKQSFLLTSNGERYGFLTMKSFLFLFALISFLIYIVRKFIHGTKSVCYMIDPPENKKINQDQDLLETKSWKSLQKTIDLKSWTLLGLCILFALLYKFL